MRIPPFVFVALLLSHSGGSSNNIPNRYIRPNKKESSSDNRIPKKNWVFNQRSRHKTKIHRAVENAGKATAIYGNHDKFQEKNVLGDEYPIPYDLDRECTKHEILVGVEVLTDWYSNETTWEIVRDLDGTVVQAGFDFLDNQLHLKSFCLPLNCYTFTIHDSKSDGLCCDYGLGEFNVYTGRYFTFRHNILTGSNFGSNQSVSFGGACKPLPETPKTKCVNMTVSLTTGNDPWDIFLFLFDLNKVQGPDYMGFDQLDAPNEKFSLTKCLYPNTCYDLPIVYGGEDDFAKWNVTVIYNGIPSKISTEDDYYSALIGDACNGRPVPCVNFSVSWFTTNTQNYYQLTIDDMMTGFENEYDGQPNETFNSSKCVDPLRCHLFIIWECMNITDGYSCWSPPGDPNFEAVVVYNGTSMPSDFSGYVGDGCTGYQKRLRTTTDIDFDKSSTLQRIISS